MNKQEQKNQKRQQQSNGKFCKVCFDAGKGETIYKSHYVKDKAGSNGLVVCPTLLNQTCRYCHEKGHTIKFCKVLQNKEKYNKKKMRVDSYQEPTTEKEIKTKPFNNVSGNKILNKFELLMDDDSDNDDETTNILTKPNTWSSVVEKKSHANAKTNTKTNTKTNAKTNTKTNEMMISLERPKLQRQETMIYSMSCGEMLEPSSQRHIYKDILSSMPISFKSLSLSDDSPSSRLVLGLGSGSLENSIGSTMAYQVEEQQQPKEQSVVQLEYCELQEPKRKRILNWADVSDSDEE